MIASGLLFPAMLVVNTVVLPLVAFSSLVNGFFNVHQENKGGPKMPEHLSTALAIAMWGSIAELMLNTAVAIVYTTGVIVGW